MDDRIKKAVKGDEEAFLGLLMEYNQHLYKCAYYYLGNKEDVMDALQETAFKAFKYRKKLKKDSTNIRAWFTQILINYCRDVLKKRGKVILFENIAKVQDSAEVEEGFDETVIDNALLKDALEQIGTPYKEVLMLRYLRDMKIREIAFVMDKPESTIKSQIKKGESLCRKIMEEDGAYVG